MDRFTQRELQHLVERLGKRMAQAGETPDITFAIVPARLGAISIGPADHALASLEVYARGGHQGRGTLVWEETVSGQEDKPWPLIVRSVIDQFERHARMESHAATKSPAQSSSMQSP